jgi:hypothetical protein
MRIVRFVVAGVMAACQAPLLCVYADDYSFVEIARTSGFGGIGFAEILSPASINNLGEVAFIAKDAVSEIGVYRGDAAEVDTIANTSAEFFNTFQGTPAINDAGQVAFNGALQDPMGGIAGFGFFRGDGGPITTIADTLPGHFIQIGRDPAINAAGAVAFSGNDGADGLFVGSSGTIVPVYRPSDFGFIYAGEPDISDSGELAFIVNPGSSTLGVARGSGGAPVVVGSGDYSLLSRIAISEGGLVAYRAGRFSAPTDAVYSGSGALSATPVAANTGPFSDFEFEAALSDAGVAFRANLDEGPKGIFTGGDPVADKVIQIGDALFGDTVGGFPFEFSRFAINDKGQIAFVVLNAGQQVVVRADPLTTISADFDEDDDVDGLDFLLWEAGFGLTSGADREDGDANDDGDVDGDDYAIWAAQFGMSEAMGSQAMPEPSALATGLFAVALTGGQYWRRSILAVAAGVRRRPAPGRHPTQQEEHGGS